MTSAADELVVEDLRIVRPNLTIEVDRLAFRRGELTVLLGQSGVGKSTLGRAIAGATVRDADVSGVRRLGSVSRHLGAGPPRRERMAWAREVALADQFGRRHLDPIARVLPELRTTLERFGDRSPDETARTLLLGLGLDPGEVADRRPSSLSEGMAQRVNLALALAQRAALSIFDEPLGPLDEAHAERTLETMFTALEHGAALWITHRARLVQDLERRLESDTPVRVYLLRDAPTVEMVEMVETVETVEMIGPIAPIELHTLLDPTSWRLA